METIDIKRMADKLNMHTVILIVKFMHTFLAYKGSLLLVMVMLLIRVPSLLCAHVIIKFCLNS